MGNGSWHRRRFLFGIIAWALAGCADEDTSLVIRSVGVPDDTTCVFSPNPNGTFVARGVLDVGLTNEYVANLLLANQLTPRGRKNNLRTETMGVRVEGAEVHLFDADDNEVVAFTTAANGFVDPVPGEAPGFGAAIVTVIPEQHGDELAASIPDSDRQTSVTRIAHIRVFGRTLGGQDIESTEFVFPIRVCKYCTVDFSSAREDVATGQLICVPTAGDEDLGEVPCRVGQDGVTDCRRCSADPNCRNP